MSAAAEPLLSIIVVSYKMQRELPRTLLSFLPPRQRAVETLDYEIVVVDNGSPEALDLDDVLALSPRPIRVIRIAAPVARPSPAHAINVAVRDSARADRIMICIDGARLPSAYLVRRTVDALARYPDAITFVASRHLGPKPQMVSVLEGYDQAAEDALLDSVSWEDDLDRLYTVSAWAGAHDRGNPLQQNESNAFAMSRKTWEALGGYDEGFVRPGGGLCNLEIFTRFVGRPHALNVLLLGETTFHQVHGGVATSDDSYFKDSLAEHRAVAGEDYDRPTYSFLADLGEPHGRLEAVGRHFFRQSES